MDSLTDQQQIAVFGYLCFIVAILIPIGMMMLYSLLDILREMAINRDLRRERKRKPNGGGGCLL